MDGPWNRQCSTSKMGIHIWNLSQAIILSNASPISTGLVFMSHCAASIKIAEHNLFPQTAAIWCRINYWMLVPQELAALSSLKTSSLSWESLWKNSSTILCPFPRTAAPCLQIWFATRWNAWKQTSTGESRRFYSIPSSVPTTWHSCHCALWR